MRSPEEMLEENGYDIDDLNEAGTILFRNPDYSSAIVGVSYDYRVIYDYELMVEYLIEIEGMTEEEAADFVSYDTLRSLGYIGEPLKPIVMFPLNYY